MIALRILLEKSSNNYLIFCDLVDPFVASPKKNFILEQKISFIVWKTTALGDEATDCRPHMAQPRETTIASGLSGGATNRPSDVASATGARPRHGPPKMPVINVPVSADLERSNPIEWVDDEDLTPKQLRAEVRRRDRAQVAWRPKPSTKNPSGVDPDQREVLDG
ncbi:hypothetical protein DAPPUDRAFT_265548 [Daphnia pulex]|uniref:Uncharacterized protein n=1 Tax=Daphnia pulex TaxID=6669 RepID=E9HTM0_DAPPU|nr:hypothetical protein DAPPUDRAFT_265548 [Daphnia pulex]|eukprot:EFX64914.1 hypothetical protein DAPPUDRAFT_265548 [Daphnia pulex]